MQPLDGERFQIGRGAGYAVALVALGVAAGAMILWLRANRAQLPLGKRGDLTPSDLLAKATQALREGRERLIHAVEERAGETYL